MKKDIGIFQKIVENYMIYPFLELLTYFKTFIDFIFAGIIAVYLTGLLSIEDPKIFLYIIFALYIFVNMVLLFIINMVKGDLSSPSMIGKIIFLVFFILALIYNKLYWFLVGFGIVAVVIVGLFIYYKKKNKLSNELKNRVEITIFREGRRIKI